MKDSISNSLHPKRAFYNQPEIAQTYHDQRFGGASGAWVNAREINLALGLVLPSARVLDLGCGTGRLTRALAPHTHTVGMDAADAMLTLARADNATSFVQADAFALPFDDASFDAVVALRLVFHFAQLETLLREMRRVVTPGGTLVFDTYLWSPRALLPLDQRRWGSGIYVHPPRVVQRSADAAGLHVAVCQPCFLFSPFLYRLAPLWLVQWLERLEQRLPSHWRARAFWKMARPV